MAVFVREPTMKSTWTLLRAGTKVMIRSSNELGGLENKERAGQERIDRVTRALANAEADERLNIMHDERTLAHKAVVEDLRLLRDRFELLGMEQGRREAHIAQSELLDFLTSKRYAIAPVALANAMAGLPFVGWRQSASRCIRLTPWRAEGLHYQMLQEVVHALGTPPRSASRAIDRARSYLNASKRRKSLAISTLKQDWHFLRTAINAVYEQKRPQSKALPYRVFAEYSRRQANRSPLDLVLAEEEQL